MNYVKASRGTRNEPWPAYGGVSRALVNIHRRSRIRTIRETFGPNTCVVKAGQLALEAYVSPTLRIRDKGGLKKRVANSFLSLRGMERARTSVTIWHGKATDPRPRGVGKGFAMSFPLLRRGACGRVFRHGKITTRGRMISFEHLADL